MERVNRIQGLCRRKEERVGSCVREYEGREMDYLISP